MDREIQYLLSMIRAEEYEQIKRNGFRMGSLPLAESVFLFEEMKESGRVEYEPSCEEILKFCKTKTEAEGIRNAFGKYVIPVNEDTVGKALDAMRMFGEIEEISDALCAYLIRSGITPTLENLYRLRKEGEEDRKTQRSVGTEGEIPPAWTFPEGEERSDVEILTEAELSRDAWGENLVSFLRERNLYLSPSNLRLLDLLWKLDLPFDEERAAEFAARHLRRGIRPAEGVLTEKELLKTPEGTALQRVPRDEEAGDFFERSLTEMEEDLERLWLKDRSAADIQKTVFGEYRETIGANSEYAEVLSQLKIPVTADHLFAMRILSGREGIYPMLAGLIGEDMKIAERDAEELLRPEPVAEKLSDRLLAEYRKNMPDAGRTKCYIDALKVLRLMKELEKEGFYECLVRLDKKPLRFRLRRVAKDTIMAVCEDPSVGGLYLRLQNNDLFALSDRTGTLSLVKERWKGAFDRITILPAEEFRYGDRFYT